MFILLEFFHILRVPRVLVRNFKKQAHKKFFIQNNFITICFIIIIYYKFVLIKKVERITIKMLISHETHQAYGFFRQPEKRRLTKINQSKYRELLKIKNPSVIARFFRRKNRGN